MRAPARPLLALAIAAAAVTAPVAYAATNCVGPDFMFLCVTTPSVRVSERTECVYAGGTTCKTVTIPWVTTSGSVGYGCGGSAWTCGR